ncbi:M-phase inducer phosphatase 2 isoform X1 [Syngnathus typhle]|uniref:M-phase inducer phosphatase 2 isoform X1 n=1 Tax=Syngnathus typhle TaxID=161592 RepID=UPI002A699BB9|nr:M-phase inducer phosphatase 2 isoform X1 [Syngnathus typhle]
MDEFLGCARPVGTSARSRPDDITSVSSLPAPDVSYKMAHCRNLFSPASTALHSPVTNLALDMNKLVGLGSQCDTPKRSKHGRLEKVCSIASDVSSDAGLGLDLTSPIDALELENSFEKAIQQSSRVHEKMPVRRNNSLPLHLLCFSPPLKGSEPDANRYGVFGQHPVCVDSASSSSSRDNKENIPKECFEFKKPNQPVARTRLRSLSNASPKDTLAQRPNSAPALMVSPSFARQLPFSDDSPLFLRCSTLTSLNDDDDGFLDAMDAMDDNLENSNDMPQGMTNLLTAPLVADSLGPDSPVIRCRPRSLFRSPSMPSPSVSRPCAKRPDCPGDDNTPMQVKRRRSLARSEVTTEDVHSPKKTCPLLQRSKSFCHMEIDKVLDRNDDGTAELIGDFSKPYALPTVHGKHQDLKYITGETVVAAMKGEFSHLVDRIIIIDCRYPYEYDGGHIKGALNLYLEDEVEDFLLQTPVVPLCPDKRIIVMFHCEFSSERGPRMCRYVRERDRSMNDYPKLHYPELYVLKGGYKEFFPLFQMQCEPESYRTMMDEDFREDLRNCRLRSRSWAGERSKRGMYSRLKKL